MSETFGAKLRDFAGYTSIHGFGRIADSVFILRKVFWICALSASFGMCVFQVYRLSLQFIRWYLTLQGDNSVKSAKRFNYVVFEGVNTKVSVTFKELEFPAVTFCNLNPLKLSDVLQKPELVQILNETDNAFGIGINYPYPKMMMMMKKNIDDDDHHDDDHDNDNDNDDDDNDDNDNDDEDNDNDNDDDDNDENDNDDDDNEDNDNDDEDNDIDNDDEDNDDDGDDDYDDDDDDDADEDGASPLHTAKEVFRLRMGSYSNDEIFNMSIPMQDFILSCRYQGAACEPTEITQIRDEDYGMCYMFKPKVPIAKLAGPSMGLEFILNVHQEEYIPIITDSSGIRVAIHNREYFPDIRGSGISLATSVETNIALTQRSFVRHPGSDGSRCDIEDNWITILVCMEQCIGTRVADICYCLSSWLHETDNVDTMCSTPEEISCMKIVQSDISSVSAEDCDCKVPCREVTYNKEVSTTAYPAVNQQGVLEVISNTDSASFGALKESVVYLKVYLASLTDELTEEELAYTEENFVSDIGGQLGLWVGMSVLSIMEVVELIILLCIRRGSRDSKTDVKNFDKKRSSIDNY
ncbi:epithelial sodium channel subunit beta-like [Mytilus edulis]|uniref:epithelial sodium channel subunit beta-like n=1 Tax=Mytilus edulis TaxID=6550 RepID=UPI0039F06BAF